MTASSSRSWLRIVVIIRLASAGSACAAASASSRNRIQIGSMVPITASAWRLSFCDMGSLLRASIAQATPPPNAVGASGAPGQEGQDALFVRLVSHCKVVIPTRNVESLRIRHQLGKRLCGAGNRILGTDRNQSRRRYPADLLLRERLARAADAGRERLQIPSRLLREDAEHALHRIA